MAYTILCDEGVTFTASELLSPHFLKVKEHDFAGAIARVSGDVYMVTMSPAFSDAYAAACLARDAVREKNPARNVFVIDTRTAFAGELAVARRLHDLLLAGKQPEQALLETQEYIESLSTVGVLDRGDVLREKQAVSRRGARIRAWMGRRLLMEGGQDGRLHVRGRSHRGSMDDICTLAAKRFTQRREKPERCVITYSGCPERAKELGKKLKKLCGFRELVIIPADQVAVRYMGSGTMMAAF